MQLLGLKAFVQQRVSSETRQSAKRFLRARALKRAQAALLATSDGPEWLPLSDFQKLCVRYPVKYQISALSYQGPDHHHAKEVLQNTDSGAERFLEIGGGHGLTAWGLSSLGKDVTVLDVLDEVEPGAIRNGVRAVIGDARQMPFEDDEFDVVFSYNSFEHIDDAGLAAQEAWRVVKPGGTVYLNFAPIYNSPLGLHAFYEIGVPYLQHLWSEDVLRPFVSSKNFWHLNYWPLQRYREMCASLAPQLELVHYEEGVDLNGLELIEKYPSCFRKRSSNINEFVVSKLVMKFKAIKLSVLVGFVMMPQEAIQDWLGVLA